MTYNLRVFIRLATGIHHIIFWPRQEVTRGRSYKHFLLLIYDCIVELQANFQSEPFQSRHLLMQSVYKIGRRPKARFKTCFAPMTRRYCQLSNIVPIKETQSTIDQDNNCSWPIVPIEHFLFNKVYQIKLKSSDVSHLSRVFSFFVSP